MSPSPFPRGTIRRYREHLNASVSTRITHWQPDRGRAGARTNLYGDWLYRADRSLFFESLRVDIADGLFSV